MAKDEADIASEQEEYLRTEALWNARKSSRLPDRRNCYNCDTPCKGHFCDVDCQRDYENRNQTQRRQRGEY